MKINRTNSGDHLAILFHKPKGVVVTRRDERGRRTVYDCLPGWVRDGGWIAIGRLDAETRGLLLFTRDGGLVERLTKPGKCVKTYEAWVRGRVTQDHARRILDGISSKGEILRAVRIEPKGGIGPKSRVEVRLDEGRNRHLRRMFGGLKDPERGTPLKVLDLKRTGFGPIVLDIPSGAWRFLTVEESDKLLCSSIE